jgi:predicted RNA binding protein YcfA (HicA-like mRNA interferase family)
MKPIKTNDFIKTEVKPKGYTLDHQTGSHMIYKKNGSSLSIPNTREISPGVQRNLNKLIKEQ